MKKPQFLLIFIGIALFSALYFLAPRYQLEAPTVEQKNTDNQSITNESILADATIALNEGQKIALLGLENQLKTSKTKKDSLTQLVSLAQFWADSAQKMGPYLYYKYSAALLENSEKSLTFAAQLLVDNLTTQDAPPTLLPWFAGNAKVLLEKALIINPNNDSAKINLGACYLFGNISDNPMQGITMIKTLVDKNPTNTYGQLMLALGGKKSGQYDKAIERFLAILAVRPNDIEAMVHLAECYELSNQKPLAIEWYTRVQENINIPEAKTAISKRIKELKK